MDFDAYPTHTHSLRLGNSYIRVYDSFPIHQYLQNQHRFNVSYPYAWHLNGNQAAIVNFNDLFMYVNGLSSLVPTLTDQQYYAAEQSYDPVDEVFILDDLEIDEIMNESFEQAASHVPCSGLTKKFISKNLRVTRFCEEEEEEKGEICVVCQVEFESKERVAVLHCKHRYHPRCITEWLVRKNVCPICKGQGLSV
ncbi:unnamed protein product [Lactuca saligna]|uniref:RING-type E3 ubiquitin transferase n=1 Tax=Lactuca saligna TaxID=75948 RepID=A0AA36EMQ7_LACSI|nr:unnamed protein product [Lactuca saligna]